MLFPSRGKSMTVFGTVGRFHVKLTRGDSYSDTSLCWVTTKGLPLPKRQGNMSNTGNWGSDCHLKTWVFSDIVGFIFKGKPPVS